MINQSRLDFEKDINHILDSVEELKKDLTNKCAVTELLETKAKVMAALGAKCDLKEVQQTLNDCQQDIIQQL